MNTIHKFRAKYRSPDDVDKTAENMSKDEQIERLVRQRNALWNLLDEISFEFGASNDDDIYPAIASGESVNETDSGAEISIDEEGCLNMTVSARFPAEKLIKGYLSLGEPLWEKTREITRDVYRIEGVNFATGEINHWDEKLKKNEEAFAPYLKVAKEGKAWLK